MTEHQVTKFAPIIHPWNQELWQHLTLEPERANHALLFNGNRGLGKRDLAFSLAHYVLTQNHSQSENLFNAGSHPDFHVLMPEYRVGDDLVSRFAQRYLEQHTGKPKRTISIDQVRNLALAMNTHPHISTTRVVLIAYAETMNRNAANALLKNLEEPPANTLFIVVSDDAARLAKTIRSRCSLINFRAPTSDNAKAWLMQQKAMPEHEVDIHLAMANNHPLMALNLFKENFKDDLKTVFTDVNGLWNNRTNVIDSAKHWQQMGGVKAIDILQKLTADLIRHKHMETPKKVFFPVQQSWVQASSAKLDQQRLFDAMDALIYAKKMLATTVDELLVLETVSNKLRLLPTSS